MTATTTYEIKQANRRAARRAYVEDMRDGRRQRSITVPSAKAYKRKARSARRDEA